MTAKCEVAKENNDCWLALLEEAKKEKKKKKKAGENNFHRRPQWRQNKQPEKKWQLFPFPHMKQRCLKYGLCFTVGRQRWAALWVRLHQIKARQQHDKSHPWEAGDLFKERGSREGARETRRRYAKEGGGERIKWRTCWLTAITGLRRAELLLPLLGVELAASPSEGQSDASHQPRRATRLRVGNRMEK